MKKFIMANFTNEIRCCASARKIKNGLKTVETLPKNNLSQNIIHPFVFLWVRSGHRRIDFKHIHYERIWHS